MSKRACGEILIRRKLQKLARLGSSCGKLSAEAAGARIKLPESNSEAKKHASETFFFISGFEAEFARESGYQLSMPSLLSLMQAFTFEGSATLEPFSGAFFLFLSSSNGAINGFTLP